ncbi:MAG: hypothetical protein WA510_13655 [Acidobacteriaceae bacterium]
MKTVLAATVAFVFACNVAAFAQTEVACGQTLETPFRSRAMLAIDSRPAGLEIVGTDNPVMHLSCIANDVDPQDIRIRFSGTADDGKLTISGNSFHKGNLQIRIEVPRKTNLKVKMAVGQVKVAEIAGDKDIDLSVGQITVSSDRLWDYRRVDTSVDLGELRAPVYGADKGGFFRSFSKQTIDGEYSLRAHLTVGQIELLGGHAPAAAE